MFALVALVGCGEGDDGGSTPVTRSTLPATTAPVAATTTIPVVVTLPADPRPRSVAVPATAELDGLVTAQPTFDMLARHVVDAVDQRYPAEAESQLRTDSAVGVSGTSGTVLVRRIGFADDSVAGYEYTVTVEQGPQGWVVTEATKAVICYRGVSGQLCT